MEDNHINDPRARTFAGALRKFEQDSDPAPLTELFADQAITERFDSRGERTGEVEAFWREYRGEFDEVRTTFYNVIEGKDEFALEWTSRATLKTGREITYRGVTALGYGGEEIVWLRTYYDSAVFTLVPASTG